MDKLNNLIQKYCPEGVEYRNLGEIAQIATGKGITKKDCIENGKYPIISGGITPMGKYNLFNRNENTVTISRVGINAGFVNYINEKFYLNDKCFSIMPKYKQINNKYMYYFLKKNEKEINDLQSKSGVPTINTKKLSCIKIPIPPIRVQEEIVRILDSFTKFNEELIKELTKELINRKKQHEYYRDELLNFNKINKYCPNGIKYKKLEEFATINRGGSLQKKDFVDEGIPCIHYGQIYTKYGLFADKTFTYISEKIASKQKFAEKNDIVMAVTSENLKDVCSCLAWLGNEKIAISGHTAIIHHNQNAKFMSYYFHSIHFQKQKNKLAHGTKVIEVTPSKLKNIIIPIPSIVEQECIVDILDKFEVMYNNLYSEISAEIELRKKQYEYYRDKILTFKELKQ